MNLTLTGKNQKRKSSSDRPLKRQRSQRSFATQIGATGSLMTPEKKNLDRTDVIIGTNIWSPLYHLSTITQGTGPNNRLGRRVTLRSILIRCYAIPSGSNWLRWMVVYDHAPNGVLPLITDILTIDDVNAPNNLVYNDRFMILHDNLTQNQSDINTPTPFKLYMKLGPGGKGLQMQFTNGTSGSIADVTTGAIYIACCGSASGNCSLDFTSRIRFTDL